MASTAVNDPNRFVRPMPSINGAAHTFGDATGRAWLPRASYADASARQCAGALPNSRLKARLKASSAL
jgi:hypothetical protein